MNDIHLTSREFYIYVIIGGALLGALFGLIPLILGRRRNKARLGMYGFLASIAAGAFAPVVAVVVVGVFSWVIVQSARESGNASDQPDRPGSADPE